MAQKIFLKSVLLMSFVLIGWFAGMSQTTVDKIYLKNGEYYEGEVVAIGTHIVLIKSDDHIFSVDREEINYLFTSDNKQISTSTRTTSRTTTSTAARTTPKTDWFKPVNKRFVTELSGGLHIFSPFALNMSLNGWYNINPTWAVGMGVHLDFFNYVMLRYSLEARRYRQVKRWLKTYTTATVGVGPWADYFLNEQQWWGGPIDYDFSPVFHGGFGTGLWMDTGIKIAFTMELGLAAVAFQLEETWADFGGNRIQTSQILNIGPFARMGMAF